jgi:hypothetical protein
MRYKPEVEEVFKQEMLKLRSDYIAHSLTQVQLMRSLLPPGKLPRLSSETVTQLITIAQRLRGSGQTYDLPQITEWASRLEGDFWDLENNQGRLTVARRHSIVSILDELRSVLESEQSTNR